MVTDAMQVLAEFVVPRARIHQELFYVEDVAPEPARHPDAGLGGPSAEVTVVLDGRSTQVSVPRDGTHRGVSSQAEPAQRYDIHFLPPLGGPSPTDCPNLSHGRAGVLRTDPGRQPSSRGQTTLRISGRLPRVRRGTYRIVYRINDHARTVSILDIDHRANVYRPH